MSFNILILTVCIVLVSIYLLIKLIKNRIHQIRKSALESYLGSPFFEFLSGFFDRNTHPKLDVNPSKIPNKPCLFLMNHLDVSDPLFILKIIKMQKKARKLIYVATTDYNRYPGVKKLLEAQKCIFVDTIKLPKGITSAQCKMTSEQLATSNLSDSQKQEIKQYNQARQKISDKVISDSVSRLKDGHNVFIFPSGSFDHYSHFKSLVRMIKPGAAKATLQAIDQEVDADVVILKKLGIPSRFGGSFFWSLPYMLSGGSRNVTMSLEAVIPLSFLNTPAIIKSKNPVKIISGLYASFMSTEYLKSPCSKQQLEILPIELNYKEQETIKELKIKLEKLGLCGSLVKKSKEHKFELDLKSNPYLKLVSDRES